MTTQVRDPDFIQRVKVRSDETDGDETGRAWAIHYVLYETADEQGAKCFDLYEDDGHGNGVMLCRGHHESRMRSLALRLGEFVEWGHPDEVASN